MSENQTPDNFLPDNPTHLELALLAVTRANGEAMKLLAEQLALLATPRRTLAPARPPQLPGLVRELEPMVPPVSPATLVHFAAVQAQLSPDECAIAREVARELSASELRAWFDELGALSVRDAVARVRKLISGHRKPEVAS